MTTMMVTFGILGFITDSKNTSNYLSSNLLIKRWYSDVWHRLR